MKKFVVLFLGLVSVPVFAQRPVVRMNLNAYINAINKIEAKSSEALSYRDKIECEFYNLTKDSSVKLSDEAISRMRTIMGESLKRIDDSATFGDYSSSLSVARDEYNHAVSQMNKIAEEDIQEQKENIEKERQRIYLYNHPFDYKDYTVYSRIVNNPSFQSLKTEMTITRIALKKDETWIEFKMRNYSNGDYFTWANIDGGTCLYDPIHKKKYRLVRAVNLAVSPFRTEFNFQDETLVFALVFPGLPLEVKNVNLLEPDSDWIFRNIRIR